MLLIEFLFQLSYFIFRLRLLFLLYLYLFISFLSFHLLFLLFEFDETAVFFDDFEEIFRRQCSINSFSQDNAVCTDIELYAVFHGLLEIDLDYHVAASSHSRNHTFFFRQTWSKMNVISGHLAQTCGFDAGPEFTESAVYYAWIQVRICDFGQQFFSFNFLHGMALTSSDEYMMFSFLNLESLLIVIIDNLSNSLLVDIFLSLFPQISHDLFQRNKSIRLKSQSFGDSSMPQNPRQSFGEISIWIIVSSSIFPLSFLHLIFFYNTITQSKIFPPYKI